MYGLTTNASKDGDLSNMYINEQGRIVFSGLSSRYSLGRYAMYIIQGGKVRPEVIFPRHQMASDISLSDSIRAWNSLMRRSTSLEKNHLIEIYHALYGLIGTLNMPLVYDPNFQYPYSPGSVSTRTELTFPVDSLVVGKIPVEQALAWEVVNNDYPTAFPMCRCDFRLT